MGIVEIAMRVRVAGIDSVRVEDEAELHELFRKEVRKKAFDPTGMPEARALDRFCSHVLDEFSSASAPVVVYDILHVLRTRAKPALATDSTVPNLILYATWIEHWLNMLITVAML